MKSAFLRRSSLISLLMVIGAAIELTALLGMMPSSPGNIVGPVLTKVVAVLLVVLILRKTL
jgi:hypothetical protein